jgi:hypothetical protein
MALDDESFRRQHLASPTPEALRTFRAFLRETWLGRQISSPREAQAQVLEVALAARKALGLKPVVTVLEFTCGACSGLDE